MMNNPRLQVFQGDLSEKRLLEHMSTATNDEKGYLAVDCEMMGLKTFRDRLCLVQMCDQHKNTTLIQIAPGQESAPRLHKLLESEKIIKIFHYARADLAFLRYQLDIAVNPVFCTKIASKLARTYSDRHGLKEVAREFMNLELNKNQQSSDWGREKLSSEQIEYACNDVLYLIQIKNKLTEILEREDRMELAQQCFEQVPLMAHLDILGYEYLFEHASPRN